MSQLQDEIRREMGNNSEGIALVMAVQERDWIAEHFGLPNPDATGQAPGTGNIPPTPQSPRSPVAGRLGEKLRGLKLVTNASDFTTSNSGKLKEREGDCSRFTHHRSQQAINSIIYIRCLPTLRTLQSRRQRPLPPGW